MKKEFEIPTITISVFSSENIVTTSAVTKLAEQFVNGGVDVANIKTTTWEQMMEFNN